MKDRQYLQLEIGNDILQAALLIIAALRLVGGFGLLEHPALPYWRPEAPSIWLLPHLMHQFQVGFLEFQQFDQCVHGALAVKPTRFAFHGLPTLRRLLTQTPRGGRCHHGANAHPKLEGIDPETGEFRTAPLKAYPPGLCRIIARAVSDALRASHSTPRQCTELSEALGVVGNLSSLYQQYDPYIEDQTSYGPDFNPESLIADYCLPCAVESA